MTKVRRLKKHAGPQMPQMHDLLGKDSEYIITHRQQLNTLPPDRKMRARPSATARLEWCTCGTTTAGTAADWQPSTFITKRQTLTNAMPT